ncbi:MAG TPA: GtrA family protein [Ktedonobacterales bacterium]|jgi:putative flippase GtrA
MRHINPQATDLPEDGSGDRRTPASTTNHGANHGTHPDRFRGRARAARRLLTNLTPARQHFPAGFRWFPRLSKFLVVGGAGVLVNSGALVLLHQLLSLPLVIASMLAVELSIAHNFVWNDLWTFGKRWLSWRRFLKFNLISLGGLVITTATLWALVTGLHSPYLLANLLGILLATGWNFIINVLWTWRKA